MSQNFFGTRKNNFLAYYICTLSVSLLTNVLKNSFGIILKVVLTKQDKIMDWPE